MVPSGCKNVYQATTPGHTQVTVLACYNAAGEYLPPYIIFKGQRLTNVGVSDFKEAIYSSQKGWMDKGNFMAWLVKFDEFLQTARISRPVIVFMDGHNSHMSLEAGMFARDKNIELYCLLPHASHIVQPLDIGFFNTLKAEWHEKVRLAVCQSREKPNKSRIPSNIQNSMGKKGWLGDGSEAGLYPIDVTAIYDSRMVPSHSLADLSLLPPSSGPMASTSQ